MRLRRFVYLCGCSGSLLALLIWWTTRNLGVGRVPGENAMLFGDQFFLTAGQGDLVAFNSFELGPYHGGLIALECNGIYYSNFEILAGVNYFDWLYWRETRHLASQKWCWTGRVRLLVIAVICELLVLLARPFDSACRRTSLLAMPGRVIGEVFALVDRPFNSELDPFFAKPGRASRMVRWLLLVVTEVAL